ncbi:protein SIEVE ELEMENT OCCLUSION A-like [Salvia hispanica]|uniref:protein SIEVE ELEMENT OCCLUSION A-like n=1 Tax=Salvia hispanica TaxID=49212 RepID=UPI00200906EB|nr:protein SIEVE ELEMENT OCCLUSION A-like [Salvia hispanica]
MEFTSTKTSAFSFDDPALRKNLLEHHIDGVSFFDDECLLNSVECIINHDRADNVDEIDPGQEAKKIISGPNSLPDNLPYLLHQITCVLNCQCSKEGDSNKTSLEILQLLTNYTWEDKIVIILASFVVEYGQYCLFAKLEKSNQLTNLVALLKKIPDHTDDVYENMKSSFEAIMGALRVSIKVTRFIAKFRTSFRAKYMANEAKVMIEARNHIPIAVYWMTRLVVACASHYSVIVGNTTEISYTETRSITKLEEKITEIHTSFEKQFDECNIHIEEKKRIRYVEKLKVVLNQNITHMGNLSVLQTILKRKKDESRLVSCEGDKKVDVEVLKGKTVLLLISGLKITEEEITKIGTFYRERSREKAQYEIVWVPIVEKMSEDDEKTFNDWKCKMPWHAIEHPKYVKPGLVKYAREEWRYSEKSIMVSIDHRGKVVHEDSYSMMCTWGNAAFPFSRTREEEQWKTLREWSLKFMVQQTTQKMSEWVKENKYICLFGGDDYEWIKKFVNEAKRVAGEAKIELQMVYIYKKNTREDHMTQITQTLSSTGVEVWEKSTSINFWKRIECLLYSKFHQGVKESERHPFLREAMNMLALGDHDKGWGLISQGEGAGLKKIAKANGDMILKAFEGYSSWSSSETTLDFTTGLHDHLARLARDFPHHCNRLTIPGIEDILGTMLCGECNQPMEKFIMYRCCVE